MIVRYPLQVNSHNKPIRQYFNGVRFWVQMGDHFLKIPCNCSALQQSENARVRNLYEKEPTKYSALQERAAEQSPLLFHSV